MKRKSFVSDSVWRQLRAARRTLQIVRREAAADAARAPRNSSGSDAPDACAELEQKWITETVIAEKIQSAKAQLKHLPIFEQIKCYQAFMTEHKQQLAKLLQARQLSRAFVDRQGALMRLDLQELLDADAPQRSSRY